VSTRSTASRSADGPAYYLEIVDLATGDGVVLDGARYRPINGNTRGGRAFLLVHGMRWNFYRGPSRWLGPLLAARGYDCLALNLRDHDSAQPQGLDAAHFDLAAGIDALSDECTEIVPLAHGYGGTKVMSYRNDSGDARVRRHVLVTLGAVARNHPPLWHEALRRAAAMQGRALVVQGAIDTLIDARPRAGELGAAAPSCALDVVLLEGANHYFDERHAELVGVVSDWEARTRD
jgi:predicted alpha/beta hydrolase